MIKLNKWETQFVLLSKGWFEEKYSLSLEEKLYIIWKDRTGVIYNDISEVVPFVVSFLLELLPKVDPHFKLTRLIQLLAPVGFLNKENYKDNESYNLRIVIVVLYHFLSVLQIKKRDGTVLIQLEPIDYTIFDEYLKNKEKLPKWDEGKYITLMSARDKSLRKGQAVFSAVAQDYPKIVDKLIDTKYDCFNIDENIPDFLEKVEELINERR